MSAKWTIHVCGSRGSMPVHGEEFAKFGGGTSCFIFRKNDYALIVDCGSGLCTAGEILKGCAEIDIALTHLHYDHIIGLLGYGIIPKEAKVRLFGDFDSWFGKRTIDVFFREPFWPVVPRIGTQEQLPYGRRRGLYMKDDSILALTSYFASHPNHAANLRIDTEAGSCAVLFDYEHIVEPDPECMKGCSLLIYDGMYTKEEYESHRGWGHSCWQEGARLADKYGIERLLITHHAPFRTDEELYMLEKKAKDVRSGIDFARMGDRIIL